MPLSDAQLAEQVRSWIDREEHLRVTASAIGAPHEEIARVWPDAKRWGTDVLVAAVLPAHAEKCRWLPVVRKSMSARVHQTSASLPTFTKALTNLLGPPCNRCVQLMRGMAKSHVESSGRASEIRAAGTGRRARSYLTSSSERGAPPRRYTVTASASGPCCQTFAECNGKSRNCWVARGKVTPS